MLFERYLIEKKTVWLAISCKVSFGNHVIDTKIDHFHPAESLSVNRLCQQSDMSY